MEGLRECPFFSLNSLLLLSFKVNSLVKAGVPLTDIFLDEVLLDKATSDNVISLNYTEHWASLSRHLAKGKLLVSPLKLGMSVFFNFNVPARYFPPLLLRI